MVAVVSLRSEDEISIDSLIDDLNSAVNYPIDQDKLMRNLQYLRRSGLISVDWNRRMIKRDKTLKEYVKTTASVRETWSTVAEGWRKINVIIQNKYGSANAEYQELLYPKPK